jgi:hypothetical protein
MDTDNVPAGEPAAQDGRAGLLRGVLNRAGGGDPAGAADDGADGLHFHETLAGVLQLRWAS